MNHKLWLIYHAPNLKKNIANLHRHNAVITVVSYRSIGITLTSCLALTWLLALRIFTFRSKTSSHYFVKHSYRGMIPIVVSIRIQFVNITATDKLLSLSLLVPLQFDSFSNPQFFFCASRSSSPLESYVSASWFASLFSGVFPPSDPLIDIFSTFKTDDILVARRSVGLLEE